MKWVLANCTTSPTFSKGVDYNTQQQPTHQVGRYLHRLCVDITFICLPIFRLKISTVSVKDMLLFICYISTKHFVQVPFSWVTT